MRSRVLLTPNSMIVRNNNTARLWFFHNTGRHGLFFPDNTNGEALWQFPVPQGLVTPVQVVINWSMLSATTGAILFHLYFEAVTAADASDLDASEFWDSPNISSALSVPGAAMTFSQTTQACSLVDSAAAGDYMRFALIRVSGDVLDTAVGYVVVWSVDIQDSSG